MKKRKHVTPRVILARELMILANGLQLSGPFRIIPPAIQQLNPGCAVEPR